MRRLKYGLFLALVIFLTGCVSIPIGDGNKVKVSKEGIILTSNDGSEHTISFDTESGSLYIDGFGLEDGFGLGETYEIPKGFPADIPIPEDAKVFDADEKAGIITLAYETNKNPQMINDLYAKYFNSDIMIEKPIISDEKTEHGPSKRFQGIRDDGLLDLSFIQSQIKEEGTIVAIVFQGGESRPSKEFPGDMFNDGDPFKVPGDLFKEGGLLNWIPSDMLDEFSKNFSSDMFEESQEFPSDMSDGSQDLPGDMFDGSKEFTGDMFQEKASEFIQNNLPGDFPLPDNLIVYQANDLLGVVLIAFETDVSPEKLGKTFGKYFQSKYFVDKPKLSEVKANHTNVKVINGKRVDGELSVRFSASDNIKDGSKVVVIFKED